jgi:hypothetical protein
MDDQPDRLAPFFSATAAPVGDASADGPGLIGRGVLHHAEHQALRRVTDQSVCLEQLVKQLELVAHGAGGQAPCEVRGRVPHPDAAVERRDTGRSHPAPYTPAAPAGVGSSRPRS